MILNRRTIFEQNEGMEVNYVNKKKKSNNEKDREEYGYGYDKSTEDLKVIGQNKAAKKKEVK